MERHAGVRILDARDDHLEPVPDVTPPGMGVPVFSPDGAGLLVVGNDLHRPLRFRLTGKTWSEVVFPDPGARVQEAAFLPDGRSVVAVVADVRLEVWDWETGKVTRSVPLPGRVTALSVAADGRHVAVRCDNGTAAVLRLATGTGGS
jgi:WD40 repeat protein